MGPPDSYACAASAATREATDVYILDESVGLKSITRRTTNRMLMMTKAVTQNQEKIFKKRRCTGTRSRKRNTLDLEFINAFFSRTFTRQQDYKPILKRLVTCPSSRSAHNRYSIGHA